MIKHVSPSAGLWCAAKYSALGADHLMITPYLSPESDRTLSDIGNTGSSRGETLDIMLPHVLHNAATCGLHIAHMGQTLFSMCYGRVVAELP
jgi:hypothetical protein